MMATDKTPQPLQNRMAIVNPDGTPTDYFIRWAQERQKAILDTTDAAQVELIAEGVLSARKLIGGVGIDVNSGPEAFLSGDVTIDAKIQELLDLISSTWGSVLYRGNTAWEALAPGTAGQVLSTNGAGADPSWIAAGGGGSAAWSVAGSWTYSVPVPEVDFTGLGSYNEILIQIRLVPASVSGARCVRFSTDNGASFYGTSGDYIEIATAGSDLNSDRISTHGTFTTAARSGLIHLFANVAGYEKSVHRVNVNSAAPWVLFGPSLAAVNAIRVFNSAGGNLTGGSILVLGR